MKARTYRTIETSIWDHPWFRDLSLEASRVVFHLLTGQCTTQIPGLFTAGQGELAEKCGLPLDTWRKGFVEAFPEALLEGSPEAKQEGLLKGLAVVRVRADWKARVVWVTRACRPSNRPTSPNVVKGWRRTVDEHLPECPLVWEALAGIRKRVLALVPTPEAFDQAFREAFPELFEPPPGKPSPQAFPATVNQRTVNREPTSPPPPTPSAGGAPAPKAGGSGGAHILGEQEAWARFAQLRAAKVLAEHPAGWDYAKNVPIEASVERLEPESAPKTFGDWWAARVAAGEDQKIFPAYERFLADEDFAKKKWPFRIFMTPGVYEVRL